MNYINKRKDFISGLHPINERFDMSGSGPMANDIEWGDSLLGRLINSTTRKLRVGRNLMKIDSVSKEIELLFDEIIQGYNLKRVGGGVGGDRMVVVQLNYILQSLRKAVYDGEPIEDLIKATESIIDKTKDDFKELNDKDRNDFISQLQEFLDYLKSGEGKKEPEPGKEDGVGNEKADFSELTKLRKQMIDNLKALSKIVCNYGNLLPKAEAIVRNQNYMDKKKKAADGSNLNPTPNSNQEPVLSESGTFGVGASPERGTIGENEYDLLAATKNLKKDLDILTGDRYKGVAVDCPFLKTLLIDVNQKENREAVHKLYKEIFRYLKGDKKATLQDKDSLYKESAAEELKDERKLIIVAEKISRFSKRVMQFEAEGLTGGMGDLKDPIEDFIKSMNYILENLESVENKKGEEPKTENGPSSDDEDAKKDSKKTKQDIIDAFNRIIDYERWVIEKKELEKIEDELEDVDKEDDLEVDIDKIIEIVKLFNRAYKIYTTPTIPSGRGGGKVSNKTFREYEYLGKSGNPSPNNPGYGPWRNVALYNKFEGRVLDILKNKNYQKLFGTKTKVRIGSGELKEGAGKILLSFINRLLDGDQLYKSGNQAQFIANYFNYKIDDKSLGMGKDKELTSKLAEDTRNKKTASFKEVDSYDPQDRTFYVIKSNNKHHYIFVESLTGDDLFMKVFTSNKQINDYLSKMYDLENLDKFTNSEGDSYFIKIPNRNLPLRKGSVFSGEGFKIKDYKSKDEKATPESVDFGKIDNIYTLKDGNNEIKLSTNKKSYSQTDDSSRYSEMKKILK